MNASSATASSVAEPIGGDEVLQRTHLDIRARLIELAAMLDRLDEAGGHGDAETIRRINLAIDRLKGGVGRAADIQQIYSRKYDPDWRKDYGLL